MASVVGPSFSVGGSAFEPPGFATAPAADRKLYWEAFLKLVLKAKDDELKAGLDRYGNEMAPLAARTVKYRKSVMGPADPGAPPLQPAHGLSRTRALLTGKATGSGVVCWWLVDVHTRASWGEILRHHRAGSGRLPKRDVIGLSLAAKAIVKARAFAWWAKLQAKKSGLDYAVGSHAQVAQAQAGGKWSGWRTEAQVDAALKAKGITYDEAGGGVDFKGFWSGIAAKKGKAPTPPPAPSPPPSLPRRDPKPPTPSEPIGRHLPTDAAMAKPWSSPFAPKPKKPKKPAAPRKPKAPAAPKPEPDAWPQDVHGLVEVRQLGGSTGAKLVKDPKTGRKYVLKRGGNSGHLRSEAQADALYRALGLDVPDSRVYDGPSGPTKLAVYHEGKTLGDLKRADPAAYESARRKLRDGFAADALLGNWDVVGMNYDNVLVDATGKVLRIDNGGALDYRAQGAKKTAAQWSAYSVGELTAMRRKITNEQAFSVFGDLHDDALKDQMRAVLKRRAEILDAAQDPALKAVLAGRLDAMEAWTKPAAVKHDGGWTPTPGEKFRRFATDAERIDWIEKHYGDGPTSKWWAKLTQEEKDAVRDYTGSGYHQYNDWLRGKTKPEYKPYDIDARMANLDAALAKIPTPEPVVMYRGIRDATPVYEALGISGRNELRVGMDIIDAAYSSASPNIRKAWEGYTQELELQLEVRLPAGSRGAYFGTLSSIAHEEEFLLGRDHDAYRIVDIGPKWIVVEAIPNAPDPKAPKKGGRP